MAVAAKLNLNAAQHLRQNALAAWHLSELAAQRLHHHAAVDAKDCSVGACLAVGELEVESFLLGFQKQFLTTKDCHVLT